MDHFKIDQKLLESIMADLKGKGCTLSFEEVTRVVDLITEEVIYRYVDHLISQVETIMEINPHLTEKEILEAVPKKRGGVSWGRGGKPTNIRSWKGGDDLFWILSFSDG